MADDVQVSGQRTTLREAVVRRRYHSSPGSRRRISTFLLALVALVPVQIIFFAGTGQVWSVVAVALNPFAAYLGLRGWAYGEAVILFFAVAVGFLAVAVGFLANAVPFYLS
ncbi:hypothetical protein [Nocardioides pyridinolyticus]